MNLSDVSIIKLLPPNLACDKNVRMMCEAFDEELRRIIVDIPGIGIIPSLVRKQITDNLLLDLLAWQFHCDFYSTDFPIEKKQEIILKSLDWHTRKGTPSVVEEIVSTVFSRAEVQEWFDYGGLPYRFRIGTEDEMPDMAARENLIRAINSVKNTRSFLDKIISLIYFKETFPSGEEQQITVKTGFTESFAGAQIYHNGRVLRDGQTVRDVHAVPLTRNGRLRRNGALPHTPHSWEEDNSLVQPPLLYGGSIRDKLNVTVNTGTVSEVQQIDDDLQMGLRKHHFHDGAYSRNGTIKHDGMALIPVE